jgi:hypothetical protein
MKRDILQSIKNLMLNNQCIMNYILSVKHFYPELLNSKDYEELLKIPNNLHNKVKANNEKILNILKNLNN